MPSLLLSWVEVFPGATPSGKITPTVADGGKAVSWQQEVTVDVNVTDGGGTKLANGAVVFLRSSDGAVLQSPAKTKGKKGSTSTISVLSQDAAIIGSYSHLPWPSTVCAPGIFDKATGTVTATFTRSAEVSSWLAADGTEHSTPTAGTQLNLTAASTDSSVGGKVCAGDWSFSNPPGPMATGWHKAICNYCEAEWIMRLPDSEAHVLEKLIYPGGDKTVEDELGSEASYLDFLLTTWFNWMAGLPKYKGKDTGEATEHLWYYAVSLLRCLLPLFLIFRFLLTLFPSTSSPAYHSGAQRAVDEAVWFANQVQPGGV
jgi:hypothetical protein